MDVCPVCQGDMDDTRHVGVECFYDVHEVIPSAAKRQFFQEVKEDGSYWGTTRRYPAGTKDSHRFTPSGENTTKWETDQVPIAPIRLLENTLYSVTCCKACRADFLQMFVKWAKGDLRPRLSDEEGRDIPVRVNGSVVMMTKSEYDRHRQQQ